METADTRPPHDVRRFRVLDGAFYAESSKGHLRLYCVAASREAAHCIGKGLEYVHKVQVVAWDD